MDELEKSSNIAVAISRKHLFAHFYNKKVYCFTANIRCDLVTMKLRKTSVHHIEWNGLIQRLSEFGLIAKWARSTNGSARKSNDVESYAGIITFMHFNGVILFVFCAFILAAIIAILEQIIHCKVKQVNHHRYWDMADMLIDSRRHMLIFNGRNTAQQ